MASSDSRPETPLPSMAHSALARGAHFPATLSTPSTSVIYGSSPSSDLDSLFEGSSLPASDPAAHPSHYKILSTKTPTDPKATWHPKEGRYASWEEAEKAARRLVNAVAAATPGSDVFEGGDRFWVVDASMLTIVQYQIAAVHDAEDDDEGAQGRADVSSPAGQAPEPDDELYRAPTPPTPPERRSKKEAQEEVQTDDDLYREPTPPTPPERRSKKEGQQKLQGMNSLDARKNTPAYSARDGTANLEEFMTIKQEQDDTPLASIPEYPTPIPELLAHQVSRGTREAPIEIDDEVSERSTPAAQAAATPRPTAEAAALSPTHAEATEKAQQYVSSGRFGLYLTIARPPSVPVTYLVHLNTSLGQAQSDMKVIATNEIKKDITENEDRRPHITFNGHEVNIEKNEGAQLVYEIVEGSFVDGRFQSHMEQSGRATGESYTKEMMKAEPTYQHQSQATMGTPDVTGYAFETNESPSSQENAGAFYGGQGSAADIQYIREDSQDLAIITSTEQDVHHAGDIAMNDAHSHTVIKIEDEEQHPNQVTTRSRSRKRTREPETDTMTRNRGAKKAASVQPPRKKAKTVVKQDPADEDDEMMDVPDIKGDAAAEDPNEVYCRCKEGDDGTDMVGCDGEDCPSGGWVHWRCISTKKGKPGDEAESWLCPDCDPEKKKKKKGAASYSWTRAAISKGAAAKRKRSGTASRKRSVR